MNGKFETSVLILSAVVLLSSCISVGPITSPRHRSSFEQLNIHQSKQDVVRIVGQPTEKRTHRINGAENEVWIYDDPLSGGTQIASVNFDAKTDTVFGITVLPDDSDNESKLDELLKTKFSKISFEKMRAPRCHLDSPPNLNYY